MSPLLALLTCLAAAPAADTLEIRTLPDRPARGTFARIVVRAAADTVVGTIAGEPLHFRRWAGGQFVALAGIPVDGGPTEALELEVRRPDGSTSRRRVPLRVGAGEYARESLRVAPGMAKPDSAARRRIAEDIAKAREVSRASHATPRLWSGGWRPPRPGRITSPFGTARVFNGEVASRHLGTDYAGAVGAPVTAPNRGVVRLVDDFVLAGRVVYLDHGEGVVTAYFHLDAVNVAVGDTVQTGQRIGGVGRSGRVTGPHLHWVGRYGAVTVDPGSLFALVPASDSAR